jgi:hypothetical protein
MLNERRTWEYYTVYSIVTNHPIFTLEEVKDLFEIFSEFAKESKLFKVKPKDIVKALNQANFDLDANIFKSEVLSWMAEDFSDGVAFNEFLAFMATESLGKEYQNASLSQRLMYYLSLGTNDLRQKDIDDFCEEFKCPELQKRLTKWKESVSSDN